MAETKIEWADAVWNPVTGCTPISDGCANCYAERMAKRLAGRFGYPADAPFQVTCHEDRLDEPWRWRKPRRVFVCSMADLFHKDVPLDFLDKVFAVMALASHLTFMVLTKRPGRMREYLKSVLDLTAARKALGFDILEGMCIQEARENDFPNVWLGVTAENQARADERIPVLLDTPATVRFVSIEPMLGPVDFRRSIWEHFIGEGYGCESRIEWAGAALAKFWVICGGETGPGARPMHPDWPRSLRDQCQAAGVPFFFKQWGEWAPWDDDNWSLPSGADDVIAHERARVVDGVEFLRVGKRAAGRKLDGQTWDQVTAWRAS